MSKKNVNTETPSVESLNRKIIDLQKSNSNLSKKVTKLEEMYDNKNENESEVKENKTDIRAVMLFLSLLGLVATAIYLMNKG